MSNAAAANPANPPPMICAFMEYPPLDAEPHHSMLSSSALFSRTVAKR
jgi:hypothetical protein